MLLRCRINYQTRTRAMLVKDNEYHYSRRRCRVSIALIRLCDFVFLSVILCICPHDKTKTAEIKIDKLGTEIVHHDMSPIN